jgi:hypothetical protein
LPADGFDDEFLQGRDLLPDLEPAEDRLRRHKSHIFSADTITLSHNSAIEDVFEPNMRAEHRDVTARMTVYVMNAIVMVFALPVGLALLCLNILGGENLRTTAHVMALTEAVRRRPYQVVLFDEVEKAHPDVFNVLLQVLDDGVLTDGQGRRVDFKQTMIVLTSNLGSQALSQLPEGADAAAARRDVMDAVRAHFRPEFLNRLDETIIFDRLSREDMDGIVDIQLGRLAKRLAKRAITLKLDEPAKTWLADQGYDPVYGARPLKRVIQRALQDPLAELLLSGDVLDGDTVPVHAGTEGLIIGDRLGASNRPKPDDAVVH